MEIHDLEERVKKDRLNQVIIFQFEYFEQATTETVSSLKEDYEEAKKSYELESSKLPHIDEENYDEISEDEWIKIEEVGGYFQQMDFAQEFLQSILEMRVVYLFKNVEVIMKRLIQIAYPDASTREFYNWEVMKTFFKNKSIDLSSLGGYNDCLDTQKLNNAIKHSDTYNESVLKIAELKDVGDDLNTRLENFYSRVKPKVEMFCRELTEAIKRDLYEFDDDRISALASDFRNRMDKGALKKFIENLK